MRKLPPQPAHPLALLFLPLAFMGALGFAVLACIFNNGLYKNTTLLLMKKQFVLACLLTIFTTQLQAQNFAGRKVVGAGFSHQQTSKEDKSENIHSWSINPSIGYFVNNNWSWGLRGNFSNAFTDRQNTRQNIKLKEITWGIDVFATYHHWFSPRWAVLIESGLGYHYNHFDNKYSSSNSSDTFIGTARGVQLNTKLGVLLMVNQRFGIDINTRLLQVNYQSVNEKFNGYLQDDVAPIKGTRFTASFLNSDALSLGNLQIGLRYFF